MSNIEKLFILPESSVKNALRYLNESDIKCLLVVNEKKELLGTLTDGDLRRSILGGIGLSNNISNCYQNNPTTLLKGGYSLSEAKKLLLNKNIDLIPVVNKENIIVDYFTRSIIGEKIKKPKSLSNVPVVIMAGGKGTRLEPFTKVLPKPLVPVHEKPIIEHIIERFTNVDCNIFYLTVNYKGLILKAYFEELNPGYKIHYIEENEPLGTAGSLRLLDTKLKKPFFVTNCDIIIKADYNSLYQFHLKGGYDISLVASAKEYVIPYGTCELNSNGNLSIINEKPRYDFLINTGLYVLNPNVLELIPENKLFHFTHLIEVAMKQGNKVGVYPIDDDAWIDVGQWAEYQHAVERL